MARPRQFDPGEALVQAMEIFWAKGFEATSIEDLVRATGMNRSSLYEQFGDKHALFLRSLEHYDGIFFQLFLDDLAGPARGVAAIHRCLDNLEARLLLPEAARGCFMLNTSGDIGSRGPEIARRIRLRLSHLEGALAPAIEARAGRGATVPAGARRAAARFLNALMQGITTMRKATGNRTFLRAAITMAHATVDSWRHDAR